MRIIAGKFRGTIINSPKSEAVKPTLDRVKENIFNKIQFSTSESVCLDLFAGTGGLGLEACSRGAKTVYFVDSESSNIDAINKLKQKLLIDDKQIVTIKSDYLCSLEKFKNEKIKFDIIFLDPPYKSDYDLQAIDYIERNHILNDEGIIVWEQAYELFKTERYKGKLTILDKRKYGTVMVCYLKNNFS